MEGGALRRSGHEKGEFVMPAPSGDSRTGTACRYGALVAAALAVAATTGHAAVLEEVVVTAQKRAQSLQDVGIAITAFTGDQLEALNIAESYDVAAFTPGVHISGNLAGQNTQFTIRGSTQNDFNDIVEAPNAVYLDEGYFAIAQAQTFSLFDIDRVEILKGPQGTLFGRNATGGMVHYHSRQPSFDAYEGYVDVTYGRFDSSADADQVRVRAAAGGPLSETLAGRGAVMYNQHDGYLENEFPALGTNAFTGAAPAPDAGADLGDDDTFAGRGILLFEPTETVSVTATFNYARSEVATGPYQSKPTIGVYNAMPTFSPADTPFPALLAPTPGTGELINVIDTPADETRLSIVQGTNLDAGCDPADIGFNSGDCFDTAPSQRPVPGGDFFGYRDPDGADFDTTSGDFAFEDQGETETWGVNARLEWELANGWLLTAVTDYKDYEKLLFIDVDAAPVNTTANYAAVDATSFTQELRLNGETARSRWVAGFFFLHIDTDSDNGLKAPPGSVLNQNIATRLFGVPTSPSVGVDLGTDAFLETDSYSLFGQVEFDLTERLTLIGGLRVIQEEKDYEMTVGAYNTSSARSIHEGGFVQVITPSPTANGIDIGGGAVLTPAGSPAFDFAGELSDTLFSAKLQLDWHVSDDLLLYAGVNRGVKAGSFNAPIIGAWVLASSALAAQGRDPNAFIPYDEEVLISYEGGFKSTVLDGTTRINASLFYYDYRDYQAFLFTGIGGNIINKDQETIGAEIEVQSTPMPGLDTMLGVSWIDATVEDVPLRIGSSLIRDVEPNYTPEWQVSGLARYEWRALGGWLSVQADFSYSDSFFYNLRNFDADQFDEYILLNAELGWTSEDEHWQARLMVNNLTDEEAGVQGFDIATACGCNEVSYRAPRWYGVSLKYSFF